MLCYSTTIHYSLFTYCLLPIAYSPKKMNLLFITGITASIFSAFSLLPQLIKLLKEKKAENISVLTLFFLFAGLGAWVYYGVQIEDWIIIISNSVSVLINLMIMILTFRYRK